MDPYTHTREKFTQHLLSGGAGGPSTLNDPCASASYTKLANSLRPLLEKLASHPAMAPNLHQTYMTPAANKNKVYFMWDFVGRTLGIMYNLPPFLPKNMHKRQKEAWTDAIDRTSLTKELILDSKPGMLDSMTEATYPEQKGRHPRFGEEIVGMAREL
ncbi:MAG: hypothetical protein Q9160_008546 [Pyrenula sp. 1 TL-2023]